MSKTRRNPWRAAVDPRRHLIAILLAGAVTAAATGCGAAGGEAAGAPVSRDETSTTTVKRTTTTTSTMTSTTTTTLPPMQWWPDGFDGIGVNVAGLAATAAWDPSSGEPPPIADMAAPVAFRYMDKSEYDCDDVACVSVEVVTQGCRNVVVIGQVLDGAGRSLGPVTDVVGPLAAGQRGIARFDVYEDDAVNVRVTDASC